MTETPIFDALFLEFQVEHDFDYVHATADRYPLEGLIQKSYQLVAAKKAPKKVRKQRK